MSVHRYEDAAFTQDFLLHNINAHGYMSRLCHGFQKERYPDMPPGLVRSVTAHTFMRADPVYVSDDVMSLWEKAAETFKLEKLTRTDLVVPSGFALFPRPFEIIDIHGKRVAYRALGWLPISQRDTYDWDQGAEGQGVWLTLLSNVNDIDDYWEEEAGDAILGGEKIGVSMDGKTLREISLAMGEEWTIMHASVMMFDADLSTGIIDHSQGTPVPPDKVDQATSMYSHIQCFWRLMSQLVMTPEPLPRQARRQRAQRIDTVKVLKLRRYRHRMDHEGDGPGIEYTHRWVVEGHWRNQPYGPKDDPYYKQIWIAPYVKGPDDKPLVVKKRGVEFDR
jgi:hypothetical protein